MKHARGFTLLELLIVISIIGVLVGLGLPALMAAKRASKERAMKGNIVQLDEALGSYMTKFADYPPSGGFTKGGNEINCGSESLVWHMFTKVKGGPFLDMGTWQDHLTNTDADDAGKKPVDSMYELSELKELADIWAQPIVYIHNRDYAKPAKVSKYEIGGAQECVPQKSKATGNYNSPGKYQIWSVGADKKNQNGEEDDISNWK